jgi:hypothetical protein
MQRLHVEKHVKASCDDNKGTWRDMFCLQGEQHVQNACAIAARGKHVNLNMERHVEKGTVIRNYPV